MNILQNASFPNDMMQIRVHELEDQIQIVIVVSPMDVEQLDDVRVVAELPEEDDFSEGALGVRTVAEGVVDALDGHDATGTEKLMKRVYFYKIIVRLNDQVEILINQV